MAHYIIQIIFFQLFFLLVYEIFLKKETFFNYNRLYLLLTPILAFLIPWLRLEFLVEAVPENARILIPQAISGQPEIYRETLPTVFLHGESGLQLNWWLITYFTGFATSLFIFIRKYQHLNRLFSFRQVTKQKNFRIIEVPGSDAAYTFFNTIFLGDQLSESEKQHILSHELVHVKQKHSLDLIFFEILKIVYWFNPLIYIYQNRIAGLHEFIADDEVVKTTEKKTYYEQLLNTAFNTQNISFINQFFNHSLIKKRILMLQKNKSSKLSKFKFLLVIPLMLAMLTYVACSKDISIEEDTGEFSKVEHEKLLNTYWKELKNMEAKGISWNEITSVHIPKNPQAKTTKEEYYRFLVFSRWVMERSKERKLKNGTYNEADKKFEARHIELQRKTYEEYLQEYENKKINKPIVIETKEQETKSVPFAVIEQVPVFPGCENLNSNKEQKDCMSEKISMFVNNNFDTSLGKKLGLTGVNRIIVQFRIDETGNIQDARARAPHPELEAEAKRVISSIPQMQPGKQKGMDISVMYSLPIAFKVSE